jgi:hypothetical protein
MCDERRKNFKLSIEEIREVIKMIRIKTRKRILSVMLSILSCLFLFSSTTLKATVVSTDSSSSKATKVDDTATEEIKVDDKETKETKVDDAAAKETKADDKETKETKVDDAAAKETKADESDFYQAMKEHKYGSHVCYETKDGFWGALVQKDQAVTWIKVDGKWWYGVDSASFNEGDFVMIHTVDAPDNLKNIPGVETRGFYIKVIDIATNTVRKDCKPFNVYAQIDESWANDNFVVMSGESGGLIKNVSFKDWDLKNSEKTMKVAVIPLNSTGAYIMVYADRAAMANLTAQANNMSQFARTADTFTNKVLFGLPAMMLLALGGLYVSRKKKIK